MGRPQARPVSGCRKGPARNALGGGNRGRAESATCLQRRRRCHVSSRAGSHLPGRERLSAMLRHVLLIIVLSATALAAGVAMVPGEREQWTMLVRDGRNEQALKALEAQYQAGRRNTDAVVHLYRLYMSFAKIDQATVVMEQLAAEHPDNPEIVAMLARHYTDIQDKPAAIATLERLFEFSPSTQTAR